MKFTLNKNSFLIYILFLIVSFANAQTKFKVTLDAGHGGKDTGAKYHGNIEKEIALAVVLKVGKILEDQSNVNVNYTRKTDVFIDLVERANIANRFNANIFVSIHCNANKNQAADGTETYVMGSTKNASSLAVAKAENEVVTLEKDYKKKYEGYNPNSPESIIGTTLIQEEFMENSIALASKIQEKFAELGKKLRGGGVKQAPYMVLHKAAMPRVLIEMGFISNEIEGAILNSEEGQNDIARAIATAIISYKKEYFGDGDTDGKDDYIKPVIKESPKTKTDKPTNTVNTENKIEFNYKVQLSVSNRKLKLTPNNFKGLDDISLEKEGRNYKYFYGDTYNTDESKMQLKEAKAKGYRSAFIVTFKNGKKIN